MSHNGCAPRVIITARNSSSLKLEPGERKKIPTDIIVSVERQIMVKLTAGPDLTLLDSENELSNLAFKSRCYIDW